mmetsp:Transcript_3793/g.4401  ORF Transcript_3793/g.4401 Transcript_3793/m.4401 type:complete len:184 (+) Transcript_3793:51-602(+)
MVGAKANPSSFMYNNRITQLYSNFHQSLEESFQGVYTGLNLMFKFDKEAYEERIRFKSPDEKFTEMIQEQGFDSIDQWLEHKYSNSEEEVQKRNMAEITGINPYHEVHNKIEDPCAVNMMMKQYTYYCNNTRVTLQDYIHLSQNTTFNCEKGPREEEFESCYKNYEKCPQGKADICSSPTYLK